MIDRVPPRAGEIEIGVLGLMLRDPESRLQLLADLTTECFYEPQNQTLFRTMSDLQEEGEGIDLLTVSRRLEQREEFDMAEAWAYLLKVDDDKSRGSKFNLKTYVRTLREEARKRTLLAVGQDLSSKANDADPEALSEEAIRRLRQYAPLEDGEQRHDAEHVAKLVIAAYEEAEKLTASGRQYAGLDTGFMEVNMKLNGLRSGELTIIAARTSIGKSTLALQIALHVSKHEGVSVGFLTTEMTQRQIGSRMACILAGIDPLRQQHGQLSAYDRERFVHAVSEYALLPINVFGDARSMPEIERRLRQDEGAGLWVIDHLHRIQGSPSKSSHERLTDFVFRIKDLALELEVPILLLAQLNRNVEARTDKKPQLGDLRESGAIEEHADNVIMIYRPGHYRDLRDRGFAETEVLILAEKTRFGPVGTFPLVWVPDRAMFANPDWRHASEERTV